MIPDPLLDALLEWLRTEAEDAKREAEAAKERRIKTERTYAAAQQAVDTIRGRPKSRPPEPLEGETVDELQLARVRAERSGETV